MSDKTKKIIDNSQDHQANTQDQWNEVMDKKKKKSNSNYNEPCESNVSGQRPIALSNKLENSPQDFDNSFEYAQKNSGTSYFDRKSVADLNYNNNNNNNNYNNNNNNSVQYKSKITPNEFREYLQKEFDKSNSYFDQQYIRIKDCQQVNGFKQSQIMELKNESESMYKNLRNMILSYINFYGGIIFFGISLEKDDKLPPCFRVNGFKITQQDKEKYTMLQSVIKAISNRITPKNFKIDLSFIRVIKNNDLNRIPVDEYVARVIIQQGPELGNKYVYRHTPSSAEIQSQFSKYDKCFVEFKGEKKHTEIYKVKDFEFTHIDHFQEKLQENSSSQGSNPSKEDQNFQDDISEGFSSDSPRYHTSHSSFQQEDDFPSTDLLKKKVPLIEKSTSAAAAAVTATAKKNQWDLSIPIDKNVQKGQSATQQLLKQGEKPQDMLNTMYNSQLNLIQLISKAYFYSKSPQSLSNQNDNSNVGPQRTYYNQNEQLQPRYGYDVNSVSGNLHLSPFKTLTVYHKNQGITNNLISQNGQNSLSMNPNFLMHPNVFPQQLNTMQDQYYQQGNDMHFNLQYASRFQQIFNQHVPVQLQNYSDNLNSSIKKKVPDLDDKKLLLLSVQLRKQAKDYQDYLFIVEEEIQKRRLILHISNDYNKINI